MNEKDLSNLSTPRVALELMRHIANEEPFYNEKKQRDYWFKLYDECLNVVAGRGIPAKESK